MWIAKTSIMQNRKFCFSRIVEDFFLRQYVKAYILKAISELKHKKWVKCYILR